MRYTFLIVAAVISLAGLCPAQDKSLVIADFNKQTNISNTGGEFGTWEKDANDPTQSCRLTFARSDALGTQDGMSVRLDYDVDSPNPAYNGFWLKLDNVEVLNYTTLSFYVRGDAETGFTGKIKIEIKDKKGGKVTQVVEGISDKWQRISIPVKFDRSVKKPLSEFTIVFDDINSRPKVGAILIDEIELAGDAGT